MANLHRSVSTFLFISYIAAIVLQPARSELLYHKTNQQHVSYNLRPQDFPNERLYRSYLAIQRFKSTITSDPKNVTATWTGDDLCGKTTYEGFYCGALPGQDNKMTVTAVILNGYSLHAPKLQGFVDELPDLALFHAASNNFGGDIPRLTSLGYMYELNAISDVPLQKDDSPDRYGTSGGGGVNIFGPNNCVTASLNFTFHFGIPGGKGGHFPGVTDAKALLLNHNNISGPLPSNIGFSKLSYLALANNKLTGPIPTSISHLQDSLFEVLLLNNQLSGCLPHELGMLTKATVIDAGMNQLTWPNPVVLLLPQQCRAAEPGREPPLRSGARRALQARWPNRPPRQPHAVWQLLHFRRSGMRGADRRRRAGREEQLHSGALQPEAPGGVRGVPEPAKDVPGAKHSVDMPRRSCHGCGGARGEEGQGLLQLRDVRYAA